MDKTIWLQNLGVCSVLIGHFDNSIDSSPKEQLSLFICGEFCFSKESPQSYHLLYFKVREQKYAHYLFNENMLK